MTNSLTSPPDLWEVATPPLAEPRESSELTLRVRPWRVTKYLLGFVGLLVVLNLVTRCGLYAIENQVSGGVLEIAYRLDLDRENTIAVWYSSATLLVCAGLLALIAWSTARRGGEFVWHWAILSLAFVWVSLDESAAIHEISMSPLRRWLDVGGVFYFAWIIPGMVVVGLFGLAYLKFLARLAPRTRNLFLLAGATFVGGALGIEAVGGYLADGENFGSLSYILVSTVEETCEMVGVAIFLYALLDYLGRMHRAVRLQIGENAFSRTPHAARQTV